MLNGKKTYLRKKFSSKIYDFFQFCVNDSLFQIVICKLWCSSMIMLHHDLFACVIRVEVVGGIG